MAKNKKTKKKKKEQEDIQLFRAPDREMTFTEILRFYVVPLLVCVVLVLFSMWIMS